MEAAAEIPTFRNREEVRRYIAQRTSRSVEDMPSVQLWRLAGRAMLGTLVTYAAYQYYMLHVFVEILSLPSTITFIGN
jgi:hypothetical protein